MRVFNVDISRKGISPVVQVTEHDAMSRFFTLVLRDGAADYEEPEGATYSVWYKTADSHGWYDTITEPDNGTHPAVVADGNEYTIEIAEQATTSCGELALCITAPDGYQLTVSGIITRSADIPGYDGEEVENYYNVYITEMRENAARAENAADIAVAYGATVEVDEEAQQLNITHHSDTEGGVGWLFGSAVTSSAEGSVAAFADGANDVAVKSLVAEITPVQSGSGDPSPTNVRPISGRTGLTVAHSGTNLLDGISWTSGVISANGVISTSSEFQYSGLIPVESGETYKFVYYNYIGTNSRIHGYDASGTWVEQIGVFTGSGSHADTITIPSGVTQIRISTGKPYRTNIGLLSIASETTTIPIAWESSAGTIYGGTLDVVSGVLTVTHAAVDMGTLTWQRASGAFYAAISDKAVGNFNLISSMYATTTASTVADMGDYQIKGHATTGTIYVKDSRYTVSADFKTAVTGQTVCYELATPQSYNITPITDIKTLLGGNTIYTDAGAVSVEYVADTKLYIDNKVAELQALILEN